MNNVVYIWLWFFLLAGDHTFENDLLYFGSSLLNSLSVRIVTICKIWDAFMHIMLVNLVFISYHWICKICLFMP